MEFITKTIDRDLEYLRQSSTEVDFKIDDYKSNIDMLKDYCATHGVLALAAIQIGIPRRIVYVKNTNVDNLLDETVNEQRILINPVVISRKGKTKYWEACASCLDNMGLVKCHLWTNFRKPL